MIRIRPKAYSLSFCRSDTLAAPSMRKDLLMSLAIPSRKKVIGPAVFILLVQRIGYIFLGKGHSGTLFLSFLAITINVLAISYSLYASRRGRGVFRIFWMLFA